MNIRGGVLEVGAMIYTDQFGGGRVTRRVVLRPEIAGGGMLQADEQPCALDVSSLLATGDEAQSTVADVLGATSRHR